MIEHIIFIDSLVVAVNVDSSNISGLTAQMHKLGQYNENRHINHEDMSNDSDLICTQQIPSPIILPTITTHSLSQSSFLVSDFFYCDGLMTHRKQHLSKKKFSSSLKQTFVMCSFCTHCHQDLRSALFRLANFMLSYFLFIQGVMI